MKKVFGKYCAIARDDAGYTQETAESVLCVSARSISAYECGVTLPPAEIVALMIKRYDAPWLGYQYLRCNDVGQELLPDVPIGRHLSASILDLQVEMNHVTNVQSSLAEVGRDNTVTEEEKHTFERCRQEIWKLVGSALSVIMAPKEKPPVLAHRRF